MTDVILYGNPLSTYTRTARLAFEEKGVAYELQPVDHQAPDYREIHPFGKIPAMRHGSLLLYETMAIAKYVDAAFDGPPLQPSAIVPRAVMNQWISSIIHYYYGTMIRKLVFERFVAPMQGRATNEALVAEGLPEIKHQISVLEETLGRTPHLGGDDATIADMFLYPVLFYVNFSPEGQEMVAAAPAVSAWLDRMGERAAVHATIPPIDKMQEDKAQPRAATG